MMKIDLAMLRPGAKAKGGSINSRRTDVPTEGLEASIALHGLLVPLIVRNAGFGGAVYDVIAGNRRLRALNALAKNKVKVPELDYKAIPCVLRDDGSALELSLVENIEREGLHPVDEFEVLAEMVDQGYSLEEVAKRRQAPVKSVRQALALGRMSPAVRDAWRAGKLSAEAAEAFTVTKDHKAQDAALKKAGKHVTEWNVRQLLAGDRAHHIGAMLKFVGRDAYEKAGHEINASLFSGRSNVEGDDGPEIISDIPALVAMTNAKLEAECERQKDAGWKWATTESAAPKDWRSWKRLGAGAVTKAKMATAGVVIGLDYNGKLEQHRGIVKPGDKTVAQPKSPKEKKAAAKKRAEKKAETGGITNMLAWRLSQQLTAAVREAMPRNIGWDDAVALTIAVLACANQATPSVKISSDADDGGRHDNDFAKYLKLAQSKTQHERCDLLMTWIAKAVDLVVHDGGRLNGHLHPGKGDASDVKLLVSLIDEKAYLAAARKHFDAKDYFSSVGKTMIAEAVTEAMGKEHGAKIAGMKSADAVKFAIANVPKTGWLPLSLRPGK